MRHRVANTLLTTLALLTASVSSAQKLTPVHEPGRCAFRGHCGKQSFFGKELPCVDNGLAKDPDEEFRKELVELCGEKWSTGPVCCELDQVCI
jgi:Niemann-Pick C1 protein